MAWPPSIGELCILGLAVSALAPETRTLTGAVPSGSTFELRGHGFDGGELVRIVPAVSTSVLPTGLAYSTRYVVEPTTDPDFFALQGVAISDAGTGPLTLLRDLTAPAQMILADRKSYVEAHFKAYNPPWSVPPVWAIGVCCRLAAYDFAATFRVASPQYSMEELRNRHDKAEAFCERGDTGEPYDDAQGPVYPAPNAPMGAVAVKLKGRGFQGHGEREDIV